MHELNICPIQNPDPLLGSMCFSAKIGTKNVPLALANENLGRESERAFLISENQISNLVLNSNTEDLVDTRQADIDTDVVLDTSRDPPDSGKHVRSGADSLAESVKSASDWTQAGDDLVSVSYQGQPDSEFGCWRRHHDFGFESGRHDVALYLEESILHEEEEGYEDKKESLKKDLDEMADKEVCLIYENREEEGRLQREGDTLAFLKNSTLEKSWRKEDEIKRISDWKLKQIPVLFDDGHVSPGEAKIRDAIRLYITSEDEEEEALSTLTSQIWDKDDPGWEQAHEAEDESVCPDSPIVLVNEGGKLVRVYPYWKWKSHVEDYEFVPIKRAFECRDEAKLEGTYSSDDEGDDDSTVESLKKGSGRIPKYEFVFELEDIPTSDRKGALRPTTRIYGVPLNDPLI